MRHVPDARHAGFTLAETLLAAVLGALLLAAAAMSAGQFAQALAHIETTTSDSYENVLARINRDVRYAWWADVPSRSRLQLVGPDNLVTEYAVVGDSLIVTRPDGATGAVIAGLASLNFAEDTLQRLRSGRRTMFEATMAAQGWPMGFAVTSSTLGSSRAFALSFMGTSNAGPRMVAGVDDRYTAWQPTVIELPVAAVGTGRLHFELYRAFGPGRAEPRPGSAAIAAWDQNLAALPVAVPLAGGGYAVPVTVAPINVPVLPDFLEPGVAYTLVMTVSAGANVVFGTSLVPAHTVQMLRGTTGVWQATTLFVPYAVRANAMATTTLASDVTTLVRTTLQSEAGETYVGSACVYSQVLADDPWLGVVPGELPAGS